MSIKMTTFTYKQWKIYSKVPDEISLCISRHSPVSSISNWDEPVYKKCCNAASILEVIICGLSLILKRGTVNNCWKLKCLNERALNRNSFYDMCPWFLVGGHRSCSYSRGWSECFELKTARAQIPCLPVAIIVILDRSSTFLMELL